MRQLQIYVDDSRQTIVLPVNGFATPFHINTIKNASKSEEGEYTYLRINFNSPGQIAGKKEDTPFEDPNATFIRSATFRSIDNHHFSQVYDQITKMRAMVTKREKDKKELADVVEQEKLRPVRQKRPLVLNDVMIRPGPDNKKLAGDLQIHENGVRYQNHNNQQVGQSPVTSCLPLHSWSALILVHLRLSALFRPALQQHQASLFPALRRRAHCRHPYPPQGSHHDRQEEGQGAPTS